MPDSRRPACQRPLNHCPATGIEHAGGHSAGTPGPQPSAFTPEGVCVPGRRKNAADSQLTSPQFSAEACPPIARTARSRTGWPERLRRRFPCFTEAHQPPSGFGQLPAFRVRVARGRRWAATDARGITCTEQRDRRPAPSANCCVIIAATTGSAKRELADRAGLSLRAISDLERGVNHQPRRATADLLADALQLQDSDRLTFPATAATLRVGGSFPACRQPVPPCLAVVRNEVAGRTACLLATAGSGSGRGRRVLGGGRRVTPRGRVSAESDGHAPRRPWG